MFEPRNATLNTTMIVWAALLGGGIAVKAYAQAPLWVWVAGALWLALALAASLTLTVTSRKVVWLLPEQLLLEFVPFLHRLQGRLAAES